MLRDKNGKTISVGSRVKLADGSTVRVRGTLLASGSSIHNASEVEVVEHKDDHDKAADGDSIIWGS